jgi:hypothetical protein
VEPRFEANLGYTMRPYLKKLKQTNEQTKTKKAIVEGLKLYIFSFANFYSSQLAYVCVW